MKTEPKKRLKIYHMEHITQEQAREIRRELQKQALVKLAPYNLYAYAKVMRPSFYRSDRPHLKQMCDILQYFLTEDHGYQFLLLDAPPRHGKSLTGQTAVEWVFGKNHLLKVMTGSYNETLSTTFAESVRNTIASQKAEDQTVVYSDIFPYTTLQSGESSKALWALKGSYGKSYLATSPKGTATGFGANLLVLDDTIKSAEEALNERTLQQIWDWFTSTMLQRMEGDWRVIVIMTRWATGDIAGRIKSSYGEDKVLELNLKAIDENGNMLCPSILSREDYDLKTQEMLPAIAAANYLGEPMDVKGVLYKSLNTYAVMPQTDDERVWAYCDTADTGSDYLCMIVYKIIDNEAYVLDVVFTDENMDTTETEVADCLYRNNVTNATFESNNGGRLYSKNIERRLSEKYQSNKTVIEAVPQTKNKEARILSSSAWVQKHVHMPEAWSSRWRAFHTNVVSYQSKGKNVHDDAPDVLASIYEHITAQSPPVLYNKDILTNGANISRRRGLF